MNSIAKLTAMTLLSLSAFGIQAAGDAKHYPAIFIGATNFESETDTTIGFGYEYKLSSQFGVGGVWERTREGHHGDGVNVWVGSFFYHPSDHWRLGLGFGEERIGGKKTKHKELMRLSASYEFFGSGYILAPEMAVDFIDGEKATVAGVSIIYPF
ncbi:hypothetical protein [Planctobacterium marinum]|uniref:hypothetical protein n=1 Tax=Planctobacterium marinum TaxID=1631968 RepID=UPI001E5024A6|nr:hypothetical protein [Planctobacterium marinum]MCC2606669.1 hypothetical protein [Planctobacterium marinum]